MKCRGLVRVPWGGVRAVAGMEVTWECDGWVGLSGVKGFRASLEVRSCVSSVGCHRVCNGWQGKGSERLGQWQWKGGRCKKSMRYRQGHTS